MPNKYKNAKRVRKIKKYHYLCLSKKNKTIIKLYINTF